MPAMRGASLYSSFSVLALCEDFFCKRKARDERGSFRKSLAPSISCYALHSG